MHPKIFKENLKTTAHLARTSERIIIACHMNPDGDALGSLLGLGLSLRKLGKSVTMLCPDKVPSRYIDLPFAKGIKQHYSEVADLAISVDCGSITQLSRLEEAFKRSKRIVEIDHHVYRTRFGDIQLIDQKACSVGEIIFLLLDELKIKIDKKIAACLLTSLLVETSSFSRPDVKNTTFDICSHLMQTGVDFANISEKFYWRKKLSAVHLCGLCFSRIKTKAADKLVWSILNKKDFERFKGNQEDADPVPDDMMTIGGVKIALLFREIKNNMLRVSLRSTDDIDVGYLASMYGGGGHHSVAGCRIHNNRKTVEKFINQACSFIYKRKPK